MKYVYIFSLLLLLLVDFCISDKLTEPHILSYTLLLTKILDLKTQCFNQHKNEEYVISELLNEVFIYPKAVIPKL